MQINGDEDDGVDFEESPIGHYLEAVENKLGMKYEQVLQLALLVQANVENFATVFNLTETEKLAVIGIAVRLTAQQHIDQAEDEIDELLGGLED